MMANVASGWSLGLEALISRVAEYAQARTETNEAPLRGEVFIRINRPPGDLNGGDRLSLDGEVMIGNRIPLVDDRREHFVELQL